MLRCTLLNMNMRVNNMFLINNAKGVNALWLQKV